MKSEEKIAGTKSELGNISTTMPQKPLYAFEEMLAYQEKKIGVVIRNESITAVIAPSKTADTSISKLENHIVATNTSVECDYEKNPTSLYKLLEQSEWKLCRIRARTFPDEVQTWVVRHDRSSGRMNIKWRLLPLHASILFRGPFDVIEALISVYPESVKSADDKGMLPLHLALRQDEIDKDIISLLLQKYPEAINTKDNKGRVPIALLRIGRAQLDTPINDPRTGEPSTLMKLYMEASLQALRKMKEEHSSVGRKSSSESLATLDKEKTSGMENMTEGREPSSTSVVQGTVVEAPNKFNEMMHLAELRTQAEAHERQMARLTADNESNKRALLDDFEERTKNLEKVWKSKVSLLKEEHNLEIKNLKSQHESTLLKLNTEHDLNMDELRESLDKDVVETKELNSILREEVNDLKQKLEATSCQSDMYKTLLEGMKIERVQLTGDIQAMAQDQDDIMQLVLQQRQEIETAYAVRDKIINSLLEQEDDDRLRQIQEGDDLMDLVESSRDRMGTILKRIPVMTSNGSVIGGGSVAGSRVNRHVNCASITASHGLGLTSIREDPRFIHEDEKDTVSDDISALTDRSR